MFPEAFFDSFWWAWVVLPLLIFLSRIMDQSIGTLRLIFVSKGFRRLAPLMGFFESIIWLLAVSQVLQHLNNPLSYIAYGAGFGAGNYIGIRLEEKLSIGNVLIRIIPRKDTTDLIARLRDEGFGVTVVDAEGVKGRVKIVFTIIKRKRAPRVIDLINQYNPNAFYTIEEIKGVKEGFFGQPSTGNIDGWRKFVRKTK